MNTGTIPLIARTIVGRCDSLGLKGKRRDAEALSCAIGAAVALEAAGHSEARPLATLCALLLCVRPTYAELQRIAST